MEYMSQKRFKCVLRRSIFINIRIPLCALAAVVAYSGQCGGGLKAIAKKRKKQAAAPKAAETVKAAETDKKKRHEPKFTPFLNVR